MDVGGRVIEMTETEYLVRGRGYLRGIADLEKVVLKADGLTPVLLRDVARIELGPDERRGLTELNGEGEVVSGIAVQRYGGNALDVIANVKEKIAEIAPSLPEGRDDRGRLRPLRSHPPGDRDAEEHADRGEPDRRPRLRRLPSARPQRAGRHHHAAGRRADGVHRHACARHQLDDHVARRHRHRHRRDDRCRHRHDRERAQASGARRRPIRRG